MLARRLWIWGLASGVVIAACAAGGRGSGGGDDDDDDDVTTSDDDDDNVGGIGGSGGSSSSGTGGSTGGSGGSGGSSTSSSGTPSLPCYSGLGGCHPGDATSCDSGDACAPANDDTWQCFPNGNAAIGLACDQAGGNLCVVGGICVNTGSDTCLPLCCGQADCTSGTCTTLDMGGSTLVVQACAPG